MHSENPTVGAEQVSQDTQEAICKFTLSGSTLEAISLALDLNVQTVIQVIAGEIVGSKISIKKRASASKTLGTTSMKSLTSSTATPITLTSCTGLV
jgi:hypothetical protein